MNSNNALSAIRIVLLETSHPGNIGAVARAMKNMGLSSLYLVKPKYFPDEVAIARASGAEEILTSAIICQSLKEAVDDCHFVFGTAGRVQSLAWPILNPREAAHDIIQRMDKHKIAIVFGTERTGMTNEELQQCHAQICIPTTEFSSLNLAQAVQVISYEIYMRSLEANRFSEVIEDQWINYQELSVFYEHLFSLLEKMGFVKQNKACKLRPRLLRYFNRRPFERMEWNIFMGILRSIRESLDENQ